MTNQITKTTSAPLKPYSDTKPIKDWPIYKNKKFEKIEGKIEKLKKSGDINLENNKSAYFAERSIKENGPAAFIINVILNCRDMENIHEVIASMLEGLKSKDYSRIAIVLGVNAAESRKVELKKALNKAQEIISKHEECPVAIVPDTFHLYKTECAYGSMRNSTLHSNATKTMTAYFTVKHFHPYISFQDFDTGSRKVGNDEGEHVFYTVDRILAGQPESIKEEKSKLADTEEIEEESKSKNEEGFQEQKAKKTEKSQRPLAFPVRPLMIAGGYRRPSKSKFIKMVHSRIEKELEIVNNKIKRKITDIKKEYKNKEKFESLQKLIGGKNSDIIKIEKELEIVNDKIKKKLIDIKKENKTKEKLESLQKLIWKENFEQFEQNVKEDMQHRDMYARLHPLLPYAPEPNLFIDATAAYKESPISKKILTFSKNGTEFTEFGKMLHKYMSEELENFYRGQVQNGQDIVEVTGRLVADAQTNRHPMRGESFVNIFHDMAIETDLSRIFVKFYLTGKDHQGHKDFTTLINRIFNGKKEKAGVRLANVRDNFEKENDKLAYFGVDKLNLKQKKLNKYILDDIREKRTELGGDESQELSEALSFSFKREQEEEIFSGAYFGISPGDQKIFFTHQIAIYVSSEKYLEENVRKNAKKINKSQGVSQKSTVPDEAVEDLGINLSNLKIEKPEESTSSLISKMASIHISKTVELEKIA